MLRSISKPKHVNNVRSNCGEVGVDFLRINFRNPSTKLMETKCIYDQQFVAKVRSLGSTKISRKLK